MTENQWNFRFDWGNLNHMVEETVQKWPPKFKESFIILLFPLGFGHLQYMKKERPAPLYFHGNKTKLNHYCTAQMICKHEHIAKAFNLYSWAML